MIGLRKEKKKAVRDMADRRTFGKDLNFAAAEAYKLLRTNLMFALPDREQCKIIGVTSANSGEGKSTTSLNLSYMLAEAGYKVLLLEADLRLPTVAQRLGIENVPGLSNMLAGMTGNNSVLKASGIQPNLKVITAGDIPPNPSELLGSRKMEKVLATISRHLDFVVIDLPPVNEVSDALVVSRFTDGMIMVVCQDLASRSAVNEAMRQLKYAEAKILGFVMNYSRSREKRYYSKKYGNSYYGGYGKKTAIDSEKK